MLLKFSNRKFSFQNFRQFVTLDSFKSVQKIKHKKSKINHLQQKPSFQEIVQFYNQNKFQMNENHFMILLSRISHQNNPQQYNSHQIILNCIDNIRKINLENKCTIISQFTKYATIIGIKDYSFWKKIMHAVQHSDFKNNMYDFSVIVFFLNKNKIIGENLFQQLQSTAIQLLEFNSENNRIEIIENLLSGFQNFQLNMELQNKLEQRIIYLTGIMPLGVIKNVYTSCILMKFENPILYQEFQKWILIKINTEQENISLNCYQLLNAMTIGVEKNILRLDDSSIEKLIDKIYKIESKIKSEDLLQITESNYQNNKKIISNIIKNFQSLKTLNIIYQSNFQLQIKVKNLLDINYNKFRQLQSHFDLQQLFQMFTNSYQNYVEYQQDFNQYEWLKSLYHEQLIEKSFMLDIDQFIKITDILDQQLSNLVINQLSQLILYQKFKNNNLDTMLKLQTLNNQLKNNFSIDTWNFNNNLLQQFECK